MLTRLKHTLHGILIGSTLTLVICGWAYISTHTIKYTVTASNEPAGIVTAENNSLALADLMPVPERKPGGRK